MIKLGAIAATLVLAGSTAFSATLDFVDLADNNERGLADGTVIAMDGVNVEFNSSHFAYLDHGSAGLGVCKNVTDFSVSGSGRTNRCASGAGDDNVTEDESVTISFENSMTLSSLIFNEEGHNPFGHTAGSLFKTILFAINGGELSRYTFGELMSSTFDQVVSATFAYDNAAFAVGDDRGLQRNAEQYYLSSATVSPVPLPSSIAFLAAGIAGLGFASRRKRNLA